MSNDGPTDDRALRSHGLSAAAPRKTEMAGSPHAWHHDAVIRAGAQRLARTVTPFRVLTRDDLAALADVKEWRDADFEAALKRAVDLGLLRRLGDDMYEVPGPAAPSPEPST